MTDLLAENKLQPIRKDLIVVTVGKVDQGKTTLTGVLTNSSGELDDGKGSARAKVLRHPHELVKGQTSDVAQKVGHFGENTVTFIDLPGHGKYVKTTIRGVSTFKPDFGLVCVSKHFGTNHDDEEHGDPSKEHVRLLSWMKIPFMFLITKVDQTPDEVKNETIQEIKDFCRKEMRRKLYHVRDEADLKLVAQNPKLIPYLEISNTTGHNLDKLRLILSQLQPVTRTLPDRFTVDHVYQVKGTGVVLSGFTGVPMKVGDTVKIGPFDGKWEETKIRNIRNDYDQDIKEVEPGSRCCLWIRWKMADAHRIHHGMVVTPRVDPPKPVREFEAMVAIWHHHTSIKQNYVCLMNCGALSEPVKFVQVEGVLKSHTKSRVRVRFMKQAQMVDKGEMFFFREGNTRGIGQIVSLD